MGVQEGSGDPDFVGFSLRTLFGVGPPTLPDHRRHSRME